MVFAAIDIGSNAVRLLFVNVFEEEGKKPIFKKGSLIRLPIRLGEDSFLNGSISEEKTEALINAMKAFKYLIGVYKPLDYLACATSAMRTASNSGEIISRIKDESGINVNLINGQNEAEIIYSTHIAEELTPGNSYLYVEVGGGSTELTLFSGNERKFSKSFPLGTVRLLHNLVDKSVWEKMRGYLQSKTASYKPIIGIGTGGNINFLFKMMRKKEDKPITYKNLRSLYSQIGAYSLDDRIKVLGLRPDRADVIMPAMDIYLSVMKWTKMTKMFVPNIGLADGIIHLLYEKFRYKRVLENFWSQ